jgi:teichuronic acid biosynthesis glycosyltransferase TuaC
LINQIKVLRVTGLQSKQKPYDSRFIYELTKKFPAEIQVIFLILEPVFVLSNRGIVLRQKQDYLPPSRHNKIFTKRSYLFPVARNIRVRVYFELLTQIYTIIHKGISFDLIHADFVYPEGYQAYLLGKFFKKPVVVTTHGSDLLVNIEKNQLIKARSSYVLENSDAVICVSKALKKKAISIGADESKLFVIYNGADIEHFKPMEKKIVRDKLGLPIKSSIVLYVGGLRTVKGPSLLIEAFSQIIANDHLSNDILLVIIGEGELETNLKQQVEQLKISNNVLFTGAVKHEEIPYWLNASDIVCVPSLSEGLSCVAIEALACGKPVVASNVGGLPEVISNEYLGFLVPPGNYEQLASTILKGLSKKWDAEKIARYASMKYSWDKTAQAVVDVYKFAIQKYYM